MVSDDNVWIVGAGGVGSVLGARMERANPGRVLLIDTWPEHVKAMRSSGLTVDYPNETLHVTPKATLLDDLGDQTEAPDLVVLAVKAYDTVSTVRAIMPFVGGAPILSLQNSINEEAIAELVGVERTVGGVCLYSAGLLGPGHGVQEMSGGKILIGELDGVVRSRTTRFAELLSATVPTDVTTDIWNELWTKLIRNAMVNGMAAVTNLGMGELVAVSGAGRICIGLGSEAIRVSYESGFRSIVTADLFDCPYEYPAEWYFGPDDSAERVKLEASFNESWLPHVTVYPSMLQDLRKKRRTEIEALNGYVVAKGRDVRVATPLNLALSELVLRASSTGEFCDPESVVDALLPLVH